MSRPESDYHKQLDGNKKNLYIEKLKIIGNLDPYSMKENEFVTSLENVPLPSTATILNYLLFRASKATSQEIKSHKSLEAYIQFACCWILNIAAVEVNNVFLVVGKVNMHAICTIQISIVIFLFRSGIHNESTKSR